MSRKLTEEQAQERVCKAHGDMVKLVPGTYKASSRHALFIDKELGEFKSKPTHVFTGHGHPKRGIMKNVAARLLPIEIIKERIREVHGDTLTLVESTYKKSRQKAMFVDKDYGSFWAIPADVIQKGTNKARKQEKFSSSCLEKYGVVNPSQRDDHFENMKKIDRRWYYIPHWRTGKILACQCSYEASFVLFMNENIIDFNWQPMVLKIPRSIMTTPKKQQTTYRIDCYVPSWDKWLEIKGQFRYDSRQKWEWFHNVYPNSELWTEDVFKEKGIKLYKPSQLERFLKKSSKISGDK